MNCRPAAPVDESAEEAAIRKVGERSLHPGEIEGQELLCRHLARRHRELAVRPARDMAGDRHVIGLIGQDEPRRFILAEEAEEDLGVGRIAAGDAVGAEDKHIASSRDGGDARLWRQRPLLERCDVSVQQDVVELSERRAPNNRAGLRFR